MKYRELGKTGLKVSAFAMGCMRLPENDPELSAKIIDSAIEAGVNYFETTRGYINGKCQYLTAGGLKGRSRGLIVSGKAYVDEDTTADSYRKEIDLQMEILGVDYLEFFQVGWFSLASMEFLTKKGGALEALDKARSEGIIGHIGFTGHDTPENFIKVIESGLFDTCTIPYSVVNRRYAPLIKRAGELEMGVIAMCPMAGGVLASPSDQLQKLIGDGLHSTTSTAFRFVLANPDVSCACSGMANVEMLRENLDIVNNSSELTEQDHIRMDSVLSDFAKTDHVCTSCRYCMDCPEVIDIPANLNLYTLSKIYGLDDWASQQYKIMDKAKMAASCIKCGVCEPKCPNALPIMELLEKVNERLS